MRRPPDGVPSVNEWPSEQLEEAVPESRNRRKSEYTPPPAKAKVATGNPRWLVPLMVALLILGLAWVVVYYVTSARYPIPGIGQGNLFAGFGVILVGFFLATRWK